MFDDTILHHVPCGKNGEANDLAEHASDYKENCIQVVETWIKEIVNYLKNPSTSSNFKFKLWMKICIREELIMFFKANLFHLRGVK